MKSCIHCGATPRSWLLSNPVTCPECRKPQLNEGEHGSPRWVYAQELAKRKALTKED